MKTKKHLKDSTSISSFISILRKIFIIPDEVDKLIRSVKSAIELIPEPTEQDAARDYLSVVQERYDMYRSISINLKKTESQAEIAKSTYDLYAKISTDSLDKIYKGVELHFTKLYRSVNQEDEDKFEAQLTPSIGKLGFNVDFYGRGYFPPGAYHSEGHQDSMGLCLYLALMQHLLDDAFTFTVLDDVLMSIDAGHRREVCKMLREYFPNTQFILTTHDPIWLKHMRTVGLISSDASLQFRTWSVDAGPKKWDNRDIWHEIQEAVDGNNIREAASLLRHYLEHCATEVAHALRAQVEFRADSVYMLGDLFPPALKRYSDLLLKGEESARSWDLKEDAKVLQTQRLEFNKSVRDSKVEEWQVNPAIHYNEWANFQKSDFNPVVIAMHALVDKLFCPKCHAIYYVLPDRNSPPETLRCYCDTGINLKLSKRSS